MNRNQRAVLVLAIVAVTALVLYPPWYYEYDYQPPTGGGRVRIATPQQRLQSTRPAGHHPLWNGVPNDQTMLINLFGIAPEDSDLRYFTMRIDKDKVWLEVGAILIVCTLLWFLVKTREGSQRTRRLICAPCKAEDHRFHDDEMCTNPYNEAPNSSQCQCAARVPTA